MIRRQTRSKMAHFYAYAICIVHGYSWLRKFRRVKRHQDRNRQASNDDVDGSDSSHTRNPAGRKGYSEIPDNRPRSQFEHFLLL